MFFYVDILRPDDEFISVLRKLVMTAAMTLLSIPAIGLALYNNFTVPDNSAASISARISVFLYLVVWLSAYAIARFTVARDELAANVWVFGTWFLILCMAVAFPDWPSAESFILMTVLAQLFRTRLLPIQIALLTLSHVLISFNTAAFARGESEYTLWALPGARRSAGLYKAGGTALVRLVKLSSFIYV